MVKGSPINWFGGKFYMVKKLVEFIHPHKVYIEVFGGAGHLLFYKKRSPNEVYNDINDGLNNFFDVIRSETLADDLIRRMQLTPYSRKQFEDCLDYASEKNPVEKARKFMVLCLQSFSSSFDSWSSSRISRRGMAHKTSFYLRKIDERLPNAVERLREVQIEGLDFRKLIPKYDSTESYFYLDPPYLDFTRVTKNMYEHEMTIEDHKDLVDILLDIKGKAMLSGYNNFIYKKLELNGWKKHHIGKFSKRTPASTDYRIITRTYGSEYVWINYDVSKVIHHNFFTPGD